MWKVLKRKDPKEDWEAGGMIGSLEFGFIYSSEIKIIFGPEGEWLSKRRRNGVFEEEKV